MINFVKGLGFGGGIQGTVLYNLIFLFTRTYCCITCVHLKKIKDNPAQSAIGDQTQIQS